MVIPLRHYWMKSQATAIISVGLLTYRFEVKWKMDQLMEKLPHSDSQHLRHFYHVDILAWTHFLHYCTCAGYLLVCIGFPLEKDQYCKGFLGFYTPAQRSWRGGILDSPCPSVRPSVCRRHGFSIVTEVCFRISVSNFMCMSFVAVGRNLRIVSYVTFKMAALWFWTMFNCNPPIAPLSYGAGLS